MRVVIWGTYDDGKPRVRLLREAIRRNGFELIECNANVWHGIEDKSQITGRFQKVWLGLCWLACYPGLIWRYLRLPAHDLVLVSYPGILDVLLIRCFAWMRRVPVAWDVFISIYDTVVVDRHMVPSRHPAARLLWRFERLAIRAADWVFMDTKAHARRLEQLFNLNPGACGAIWVGVETEKFSAAGRRNDKRPQSEPCGPVKVLFYGQFIPLHGIEHIVAAAGLLRNEEIEWLLIGRGQEEARVRKMLAQEPLPRLRWIEWVEYSDLINWIDGADICLGIFGTSEKAASVIPNKVFQIVAAGKPLITRDSPAIRELLHHCPPCVSLVPAGDAGALADAIRHHAAVVKIGQTLNCHDKTMAQINVDAVAKQLREFLKATNHFVEEL